MGSFNVACSASNISISEGTDVAFIPLIATQSYHNKGKNALIPNTSMFVGNESLYEPAMLPIFGKYNDYGSIDNIIENTNTAALEKMYGLNPSQIIEIITDGRSALESFSSVFSIFNVKKFDYSDKITKDILLDNGFVTTETDLLLHSDSNIYISIEDNKDSGDCKDVLISGNEIEQFYSRLDGMDALQKIIFDDFNYIISLSKENQKHIKTIKFFKGLSGMFIHKDIYDTFVSKSLKGKVDPLSKNNLSATPSAFLFEKLGFNLTQNEDVYNFDLNYEKDGFTFNVNAYNRGVSIGEESFSTMKKVFDFLDKNNLPLDRELIKGFDILKENMIFDINQISLLNIKSGSKEMDIIRKMVKRDKLRELGDKISANRYWKTFFESYFSLLENGDQSFVSELLEFKLFCYTFYSSNNLFMPACNGEQYGNVAVSKLLHRKALMILNTASKDGYGNIVEDYTQHKDIDKSTVFLNEIIADYIPESISDTTGLSGFEIEAFKKDNSILKEILDYYLEF